MLTNILNNFFIACPMCIGDIKGNALLATNWAILVMLFILLIVLGSILVFVVSMVLKSKNNHIEFDKINNK